MSCPACSEALSGGQDRCPACGSLLSLPVEGALAPDPARLTPPRHKQPARGVASLRRREPTWKDEVRERLKQRKHGRGDEAELPLFPEAATEPPTPTGRAPEPPGGPAAEPLGRLDALLARSLEAIPDRAAPPVLDLPLRPVEERASGHAAERSATRAARPTPWPEPEPGDAAPAPVERPARVSERLQAGAIDSLLLGAVFLVVSYFAGRTARVGLEGLLPAWPYLLGFFGLLGLAYAAYFTGLSGQTPGKMLLGLQVVDTAGSPPGHLRAAARALLGLAGLLVLLLGAAPMLFDPARRALHDRVLMTRVIRV